MAVFLTQLLLALHLLQYLSVSAHPLSASQNLVKRDILDLGGPHSEHWLKRRSLSGGKAAEEILDGSRTAGQAAHGSRSPKSVESNIPPTLRSSKPIGNESPLVLDSHGNPPPEIEPHPTESLPGESDPATSPGRSHSSSSSEDIQNSSSPEEKEKELKSPETNQDQEGDMKERIVSKKSSREKPENKEENVNPLTREANEENSTQKGMLARIKASSPTTWPAHVWKWIVTRFDRPNIHKVNGRKEFHPDPAKEIHIHGTKLEVPGSSETSEIPFKETEVPKIPEAEGPQGKNIGGDADHTPRDFEDSKRKDTPKKKKYFRSIKNLLSHIKEKIMNALKKINIWKKKTKHEVPTS